jgi:N-acetylmuramoyl-L-alanine amidase
LCEDEYAYDVSLRLARNLTQHGAIVHMIVQDDNDGIRDEAYLECDLDEEMCTGNAIPRGQLSRLKVRTDAVNVLFNKYKKKGIKQQRLIEIHIDSRSEEKRQDVFFYHYNGGESKKIANNLYSTFESKYEQHQKDRGYHGYVSERGLFTLRKALPASVYIELANIRNVEDHKRLIINTNRQALANWLFEGLIK